MDTAHIDAALSDLTSAKGRWATLPVVEKIRYLDTIKTNTVAASRRWVESAAKAKGLSVDTPLAGEEWTGGPFSVLWLLKDLRTSLVRLSTGVDVLHGYAHRQLPTGQIALGVYPKNFDESLLFAGITAEVWMQPDVNEANLAESVAAFYRESDPDGLVAVVLGAGNVASIAVMDTMYALFNEGRVVMVKMNPINDYLGPIFEGIFSDLVEAGFVRFAYGGADVGSYITGHEAVDTIHVTGSGATHDAIVFGTGESGAENKRSDSPVNTKPIGAELGGVTPIIVVPGKWSKRDLRYQAEHILAAKMHNSGFNCIGAQVLLLPDDWNQKDALLDALRQTLSVIADRDPYYPGSRERCRIAVDRSANVEAFGGDDPRFLVTGLDATAKDEQWFTHEIFGPVLAVTSLPSNDVEAYLDQAVKFANDRLTGTLGANILIAPSTQRQYPDALEKAVADLRYGTVTVNLWSGAAYLMSRCAWGAFPGHTRQDIQSGTGVVHNALMLENTQKSVVRGPFAPSPRTFFKREFHVGPKQVYFTTNKTAHKTGELLIDYTDRPSKVNLMKVALSAVRG
jgi:aldehyde dehydrogenase (NAD(P)+)